MRCRAVPAMASKMKTLAAATYAQPRKGFFPPIQDTVEITTDLVPLYGSTGKSTTYKDLVQRHLVIGNTHTKINRDKICPLLQGIPVVSSP